MIVYHSIDMDGWMSAALVQHFLRDTSNLVFANYNQDEKAVEIVLREKPETLYVVDYSFKPDVFDKIIDACGQVYWFDHHVTAIDGASEKMNALPGLRRSDGISAAGLIWEYVNKKNKRVSDLVDLVSRYDTWDFDDKNPLECDPPKLNERISFCQGDSVEMVGRAWELIRDVQKNKNALRNALLDGHQLLQNTLSKCDIVSKTANFGTVDGLKFAAVNVQGLNPSYVLSRHYDVVDFAFCWHVLKNGKVKLDLRSDKTTGTDVSRLARAWGGGGHEHAAGCTITIDEFLVILSNKA